MLKNDFRYILKRVIAGVLIALILMLIRSKNVYAQEISSYNWGSQTFNITTNTSSNEFNVTGEPWANWRYGYLYFSIGVNKTGGSSTDPILLIRNVIVFSGSTGYICNIGTTTVNNSTWDSSVYSVTCPMDLGAPGVSRVVIGYMPISTQTTSSYTVTVGGYATYEQASNVSVNVDTSSTNQAINNQITNDNTNTTNIINNQNQNTQQQIESQKVCSMIDKTSIVQYDVRLNSNDTTSSFNNYGITDYISINSNDTITVLAERDATSAYYCFYNINKEKISCSALNTLVLNSSLNIPSNASFFRTSIQYQANQPSYKLCRNGNQALADGQQQINDTLNNDDVSGATSEATSFFDDFQSDSHGLSGIITAPLRLIQGLATSSCTALTIPLPFVHENATLPCMSTIYSTHFPTFLSLYQLITTGLIGYWVLIKIFGHVKGMQDPKDDRIEVLEL